MSEKPVCLITGANSGIGFEAAVALANRGYHVVMGCRDQKRGEEAVATVRERSKGEAELLLIDLSSQASVRKAADELKKKHPKLKVLLNNAGVWTKTRELTKEGVEMTLGVNHLGHFLLTKLLWDNLKAAAPSRVVNVASAAHRGARWDWGDPQLERWPRRWGGLVAYANSKLANIWFTMELSRRLPAGVTATAVHPGGIATNIFRGAPGALRFILDRVLPGPETGARPLVRLAADGDVEGLSGVYFEKMKPSRPTALARDDEAAKKFWEYSEGLLGS